jgi:hypothetical protein
MAEDSTINTNGEEHENNHQYSGDEFPPLTSAFYLSNINNNKRYLRNTNYYPGHKLFRKNQFQSTNQYNNNNNNNNYVYDEMVLTHKRNNGNRSIRGRDNDDYRFNDNDNDNNNNDDSINNNNRQFERDHGGNAAMTWSQSDHHPGEARMTCGQSPHHGGKANMTSERNSDHDEEMGINYKQQQKQQQQNIDRYSKTARKQSSGRASLGSYNNNKNGNSERTTNKKIKKRCNNATSGFFVCFSCFLVLFLLGILVFLFVHITHETDHWHDFKLSHQKSIEDLSNNLLKRSGFQPDSFVGGGAKSQSEPSKAKIKEENNWLHEGDPMVQTKDEELFLSKKQENILPTQKKIINHNHESGFDSGEAQIKARRMRAEPARHSGEATMRRKASEQSPDHDFGKAESMRAEPTRHSDEATMFRKAKHEPFFTSGNYEKRNFINIPGSLLNQTNFANCSGLKPLKIVAKEKTFLRIEHSLSATFNLFYNNDEYIEEMIKDRSIESMIIKNNYHCCCSIGIYSSKYQILKCSTKNNSDNNSNNKESDLAHSAKTASTQSRIAESEYGNSDDILNILTENYATNYATKKLLKQYLKNNIELDCDLYKNNTFNGSNFENNSNDFWLLLSMKSIQYIKNQQDNSYIYNDGINVGENFVLWDNFSINQCIFFY